MPELVIEATAIWVDKEGIVEAITLARPKPKIPPSIKTLYDIACLMDCSGNHDRAGFAIVIDS